MRPEEVRQLRQDTGLSLERFAQLFSVSPAAVAYWERGERTPQPIYVAHLLKLREKIDKMKSINNSNDKDIRTAIIGLFLIGGMIGFLSWLFSDKLETK